MFREKILSRVGVLSRRQNRGVIQAVQCAVEVLETRVLLSVNVNVTSYHYNLPETGANTSETTLTPSNVNTTTFGKIASLPVDAQVFPTLPRENISSGTSPAT